MSSKYSYLSKNMFLFTVGSFMPKVLQFFLVPLYTNCLSPEEYGLADLISVTVTLLIPIFTLGIQDAVLRFSLDGSYRDEDVFSTAIKIIWSGFIIVVLGTLAVSKCYSGAPDGKWLNYFLLQYIVSALQNSVFMFCRGTDRVGIMVTGGVLNSVVTLFLNILLLTVLDLGLDGFLLANLVGTLAALLYCVLKGKLYRYVVLRTQSSVFRDMTVFSFPLIFNVLAWWINNASDRYILTWISGVAASGIYAVAYKIPNILSVFQSIFYQAWSISAVKEFDRDDTDGFIGNVYTLMSFFMSAACSGLLILNVPISGFLYGDAFLDAWKYAPPLLLSVVFNAMSLFIGGIFTAVKDTKTLATTTIFGAVFNTVLNFILIPRFSAYGAAIATLAGYIAVWIMRYGILRKHIRIRINLLREMAVSLLLIVQMVLAFRGTTYVIGQILIFLMIIWLYRSQVLTLLGSVMHHKRYNK